MKQKKFMDIKHAILEPTGMVECNTDAFHVGDFVVIQEKIDGANACVRYDSESDKLVCFSRNKELSFDNTLRGFWNLVQDMDVTEFRKHPNWYVFGEMLVPHTIKYDAGSYNKWYVYDIYDEENGAWMQQKTVREFCDAAKLKYVHTYYEGEFVSWEHVKSFMNSPGYGSQQEGVIVKNQTALNFDIADPPYLKLVNEIFREIKSSNHKEKMEDPEKKQAKENAFEIVEAIVTKPRVAKMLLSLIDEGQLPERLQPADMRQVASLLPKRVYEDCMKEHRDLVIQAGEFFGKLCNGQTMRYAREIILGG